MNTTLVKTRSASIGWMAGWVVASAVGLVVGMAGTLTVIWNLTENFTTGGGEQADGILFGAIFGLGLGLALGFAQWLALRYRGESGLRWIGATMLGAILGGVVAILFGNTFNPGGENFILSALTFAILGTFIGAFQFGMARGAAKSALWIPASAVALGAGASVAFQFAELWVGVVGGGAIYGIITAAALWWFDKE